MALKSKIKVALASRAAKQVGRRGNPVAQTAALQAAAVQTRVRRPTYAEIAAMRRSR